MFESILRGAESRVTLKEPPDWMWDAFGATPTFTGHSVTSETALKLPPVYAAVTMIARTIGALGLPVYKRLSTGREKADKRPEWSLLHDKPNEYWTADQLWEWVTGNLLLNGMAHAEKIKGTRMGIRRVVELWPIAHNIINPDVDSKGRKVYEIEGGKTLTSDKILQVAGFGYNGYRSPSPIRNCNQALGIAMAREEYEGRFYANDATPSGILSVEGKLSDPAAARLKAAWNAVNKGRGKGGTAVLEEGTKFQQLTSTLREQQYAETSEAAVAQAARIFNIAPEMIGGQRAGSSLTYTTVEGQARWFATYTLNAWLVRIEKSLANDEDVFPVAGYYPRFDVRSLLRADSEARAAFYAAAIQNGWMTRDEVRELEELNAVGGEASELQLTTPGTAPEQPQDDKNSRELERIEAEVRELRREPQPIVHHTHISPPQLNLLEGALHVDARTRVEPAQIDATSTVHLPEQEPPTVINNVEAPNVTVKNGSRNLEIVKDDKDRPVGLRAVDD